MFRDKDKNSDSGLDQNDFEENLGNNIKNHHTHHEDTNRKVLSASSLSSSTNSIHKLLQLNSVSTINVLFLIVSFSYMLPWTALGSLISYYKNEYDADFYVLLYCCFYLPGLPVALLQHRYDIKIDAIFSSKTSYLWRGVIAYISLSILVFLLVFISHQYQLLILFSILGAFTWYIHGSACMLASMFHPSAIAWLQTGFRCPEIYTVIAVSILGIGKTATTTSLTIFYILSSFLTIIGLISWLYINFSDLSNNYFEQKDNNIIRLSQSDNLAENSPLLNAHSNSQTRHHPSNSLHSSDSLSASTEGESNDDNDDDDDEDEGGGDNHYKSFNQLQQQQQQQYNQYYYNANTNTADDPFIEPRLINNDHHHHHHHHDSNARRDVYNTQVIIHGHVSHADTTTSYTSYDCSINHNHNTNTNDHNNNNDDDDDGLLHQYQINSPLIHDAKKKADFQNNGSNNSNTVEVSKYYDHNIINTTNNKTYINTTANTTTTTTNNNNKKAITNNSTSSSSSSSSSSMKEKMKKKISNFYNKPLNRAKKLLKKVHTIMHETHSHESQWVLCAALFITLWCSIFQSSFFAFVTSTRGRNIEQILYFVRLFSDLLGRPLSRLIRPWFLKRSVDLLYAALLRILLMIVFFIYIFYPYCPQNDIFICCLVSIFSILSGYLSVLVYEYAACLYPDKMSQVRVTVTLNSTFQLAAFSAVLISIGITKLN